MLILRGPYVKGERWAWIALLASGLALFAVKIWSTAEIYAHGILGGLTVELELPLAIWLIALGLPWRDFLTVFMARIRWMQAI